MGSSAAGRRKTGRRRARSLALGGDSQVTAGKKDRVGTQPRPRRWPAGRRRSQGILAMRCLVGCAVRTIQTVEPAKRGETLANRSRQRNLARCRERLTAQELTEIPAPPPAEGWQE